MTVCLSAESRLTISPMSLQDSVLSSPFKLWQATTQALQPVHLSRSTEKLYCSPVDGFLMGMRS